MPTNSVESNKRLKDLYDIIKCKVVEDKTITIEGLEVEIKWLNAEYIRDTMDSFSLEISSVRGED